MALVAASTALFDRSVRDETGAAGVRDAFLSAVGRRMASEPLTPSIVAEVLADLLQVDGAGLSTMVGALRLPLGGSSRAALVAERLQTTLGDGPCLSAAHTGSALVASQDEVCRRWPLYATALVAQTPYRSVAAIPLGPPDGLVGALDLYAVDADLPARLDLPAVTADIAVAAATLLAVCLAEVPGADEADCTLTPWWYQQNTSRRHQVWIAIGMLLGRGAQPFHSADEALVVLRSHAFGQGISLDDLAGHLTSGRTDVDELFREHA